jgi:hypothetical protein
MTIDEAIAFLENLERKAIKSLSRKSLISIRDIERLRRLLANLRT